MRATHETQLSSDTPLGSRIYQPGPSDGIWLSVENTLLGVCEMGCLRVTILPNGSHGHSSCLFNDLVTLMGVGSHAGGWAVWEPVVQCQLLRGSPAKAVCRSQCKSLPWCSELKSKACPAWEVPASTAGDAGTGLLATPVSILDCSWHLSGYGTEHPTESLTPCAAHPSYLAQLSPASPFLSASLSWGRRYLAGFLSTSRPLPSCPLAPWKRSSVWSSLCFVELLTMRTFGTCRQSKGPLLSRAVNGLPDPNGDQETWGRLRAAV